MKPIKILTFILCAFATQLIAQTKLIAHKSHSGSSANFKFAIENDPLQYEGSNFGGAPERFIQEAQLDSVVFITDTTAIMFTSRYCKRGYYEDTFTKWRAGKEIVYNHPLFSKQHSLDYIKSTLKRTYYFRNSIDKVKFVGYDNKKTRDKIEKKDSIKPEPFLAKTQNDPGVKPRKNHTGKAPLFNNDMIWLLEIISLVTMAAGMTFLKPH